MNHRRSHPIRVLCADDNELIGEAMSIEFDLAGDLHWLGQLLSTDGIGEIVEHLEPDVVLLDIDMPGCDSFAAIEEISHRSPRTRVLMLTGHVRSDLIDRAVEAGAWGYISKSERVPTILESIRSAAEGNFVMSPQAMAAQAR